MENTENFDVNEIIKDAGINDATTKAFLSFAKALNNTNIALKEVAQNTKETADYFKNREGFSFAKDLEKIVLKIKTDMIEINDRQSKNLIIKFFAWLGILLTLLTSIFMFINDRKIDSLKEELEQLNSHKYENTNNAK